MGNKNINCLTIFYLIAHIFMVYFLFQLTDLFKHLENLTKYSANLLMAILHYYAKHELEFFLHYFVVLIIDELPYLELYYLFLISYLKVKQSLISNNVIKAFSLPLKCFSNVSFFFSLRQSFNPPTHQLFRYSTAKS